MRLRLLPFQPHVAAFLRLLRGSGFDAPGLRNRYHDFQDDVALSALWSRVDRQPFRDSRIYARPTSVVL